MPFIEILQRASLLNDQSQDAQIYMAIHPLAMVNLNALLFAAGTRYLQPHLAALITPALSLALFVLSFGC